MRSSESAVYIHLSFLVNAFEVQHYLLASFLIRLKFLSVPSYATREVPAVIACGSICVGSMINVPIVRQIHSLPFAVVKVSRLSFRNVSLIKFPTKVKENALCLSCSNA